jgi:hypothetical protein
MGERAWRRSTRCDAATCVEVQFTKSSYSADTNCVEVGFVTASRCASDDCVEVAACPCEVLVRDSKDTDGPVLRFAPDVWAEFTAGVRAGEFDG